MFTFITAEAYSDFATYRAFSRETGVVVTLVSNDSGNGYYGRHLWITDNGAIIATAIWHPKNPTLSATDNITLEQAQRLERALKSLDPKLVDTFYPKIEE